ncbi:MAG: Maf family protein [Qingshengfaniella sp.]
MPHPIVLASGSEIRAQLLRSAGVMVETARPRVDEEAVKRSMVAEGALPRDITDALAEMKARKISERYPDALVIGCDQVIDFKKEILSKSDSPAAARDQLALLSGQTHALLSAAVICQAGRPLWRHVGVARLTMRVLSDAYLDAYIQRNWDSIRHSVGAYKLEEEGVRLFSRIEGDYWTILGIPLLELLSYLTLRKEIDG